MQFFYDSNSKLFCIYERKYDENGKVLMQSFYDGEGERYSFNIYEYDEKGEAIKEISQ